MKKPNYLNEHIEKDYDKIINYDVIMFKKSNDIFYTGVVKNVEMNIPETIKHYQSNSVIIETSNSIVIESFDPVSYKRRAIKCIPLEYYESNPIHSHILQYISDPCIIKVFEILAVQDKFVAIVMPRADYSLVEFINIQRNVSEPIVFQIMEGLLKAVRMLHLDGIWHRNLKPDNILVMNEKQSPAIAITGFCNSIFASTPTLNGPVAGTLQYAAPELLEVSNEKLHFKETAECLF